jgi:hypothetical protein
MSYWLGFGDAMGSLAGAEQSAMQPPVRVQFAKRPVPPEEEPDEDPDEDPEDDPEDDPDDEPEDDPEEEPDEDPDDEPEEEPDEDPEDEPDEDPDEDPEDEPEEEPEEDPDEDPEDDPELLLAEPSFLEPELLAPELLPVERPPSGSKSLLALVAHAAPYVTAKDMKIISERRESMAGESSAAGPLRRPYRCISCESLRRGRAILSLGMEKWELAWNSSPVPRYTHRRAVSDSRFGAPTARHDASTDFSASCAARRCP